MATTGSSESIGSHDAVLADTGPFCRLAEAGEAAFDAAAELLRPCVGVVQDVHVELRRRAQQPVHGRLARLEVLGVPQIEPITVTDAALLSRIGRILDGRRRHKPGHEDEDRGEVVTALVAASLGRPALMDDGFGRSLARREGVRTFTTQDLAVELCATGRLKPIHAFGLYRIVYRDSTRAEFDARVTAAS